MPAIGKVSLRGINIEEFAWTFLMASGVTAADVGNKAVTMTTTANTVALAGDGEMILGLLASYEDRVGENIKVGTVYTKGGHKFLLNPNATASSPDELPVPGEFIVGGTATDTTKGWVQKAQAADLQAGKTNWMVVEVIGTSAVIAVSV